MSQGARMEKGQCVPGEGAGSLRPSVSPAPLRQNLGLVCPARVEAGSSRGPVRPSSELGFQAFIRKTSFLLHRCWNQNSRLHVCTIGTLGCQAISPAHEQASRSHEFCLLIQNVGTRILALEQIRKRNFVLCDFLFYNKIKYNKIRQKNISH